MVRAFSAWVLLLCAIASAEYLSDYEVVKPEPPPIWVYGAGYMGHLYAGGVDHFANASLQWRQSRHWAWTAESGLGISRSGFLAGVGCNWLPRGKIRQDEYEDFLRMGLAYASIDGNSTPLVSLGYGRDVLPWATAGFGLRLGLRLEYALAGGGFSRETTGFLGIRENKLASTSLAFEAMLFFL